MTTDTASTFTHPSARRDMVRRSMRMSSWEAVFAMPLVYTGQPANLVLATLLAEGMQLAPGPYGFIVSLPFWCNMLQLFVTPVLGRWFSMRQVFVSAIWCHIACWAGLAGTLLIAPEWAVAHAVPLAGAFVGTAGLVAAVMGVSWTAYMQSWVPEPLRGVYFARRNRLAQISNFTFLLLAGLVLMTPRLDVIAGLILFACLTRAISAVMAHRTPAAGDAVAAEPVSWLAQWQRLRTNRPYWRSIIFVAAWGAVLNGYGAFQPVFMLDELTDNAGLASIPLALSLLFGALALPAWGKLLDRFGARPVLVCAVALWALVGTPWAFVTRDTQWLLYVVWALTGAVNAGIVIGQLNLLMKLVPAESKALAVGLNIAAASVGTAIAPILTGQLLEHLFARGWTGLQAYHAFFMTMPVLAIGVLVLLRRVQEPRSAPVEHVLGALRNFRTLGAALGLGFISQSLFTPRGKGKRSEY
ncbi:MFS transporter [Synoicihabitans lomoniglobus]|uniref:MFS transporter n=1 Tax=Synoicihabitans lomoniglobus TaxID=2909285 RepID=A0AAE9ZY11_9BACT|nr:MFS transporter [Opitutaceae bacterium LMO-M01]WED65264.1 MFS transporter [Opitutaceae bacterium LMO-M01]